PRSEEGVADTERPETGWAELGKLGVDGAEEVGDVVADMFEFVISIGLRDNLSAGDVAELRWHLGLGELPADGLRIGSGIQWAVEDANGSMVEVEPEPLLGVHGPAWKVRGMLSASLERTALGWHLDARQEVHPETFEEMTELMVWFYRRVDFSMVRADGSVEIGRLRWHEHSEPVPLVVRDDHVFWP
ncbi:hypothetical protein, partial [Nocardia sp. R6R-6]|uniref:hypothetical protein n=1 Tax=Nocardia sp. R6R-6 TaxID=3459303 RepID=UPI00403D8903